MKTLSLISFASILVVFLTVSAGDTAPSQPASSAPPPSQDSEEPDVLGNIVKAAKVNRDCANTIMREVEKRCNEESLSDKKRTGYCGDFATGPAPSGVFKGRLEASAYVGDGDPYKYAIDVQNPGACKFSVLSLKKANSQQFSRRIE